MSNITSASLRFAAPAAVLVLVFLCPSLTHASASTTTLTAVQTVRNAGINDQVDALSTTTANVAQVKATRTLTVNSVPVASTTSTIGSCVITYSSTVADSLSCSGNAAILNIATHNSATLIAGTLRTLTNVSDNVNGHGALTISGSGTTATFTTTNAEASTTPIAFTDGTSGAVTSTASTNGVLPVTEVLSIAFGGTVETGDVFSIGMTGPQTATYTTQASDNTTSDIANGMGSVITNLGTYGSLPFTVSTSTNNLIFTARTPGTAFYLTSSTTNATPVSQVVTFTPANVVGHQNFIVTINGGSTSWPYVGGPQGSTPQVTAGLVLVLATNTTVSCKEDGTKVTCSAITPGTPFTYSASVTSIPTVTTTGGGGGGGGGGRIRTVVTPSSTSSSGTTGSHTTSSTVDSIKAQIATLTAQLPASSGGHSATTGSTSFTRALTVGSKGSDVVTLQKWLMSKGLSLPSGATGYFGAQTKAAVASYQAANGITPATGYFGSKTQATVH